MTEVMPVPRNLSFTVLPAGRLSAPVFVYFPKTIKKRKTLADFPLLILTLFKLRFLDPLFHLADVGKHFESVPQNSDL